MLPILSITLSALAQLIERYCPNNGPGLNISNLIASNEWPPLETRNHWRCKASKCLWWDELEAVQGQITHDIRGDTRLAKMSLSESHTSFREEAESICLGG
jgi:hypothetical protein